MAHTVTVTHHNNVHHNAHHSDNAHHNNAHHNADHSDAALCGCACGRFEAVREHCWFEGCCFDGVGFEGFCFDGVCFDGVAAVQVLPLSGLPLPPTARLQLQRHPWQLHQPLDYVNITVRAASARIYDMYRHTHT